MRKQDSHELGCNFFDCQDEKEALTQENEIVHALAEPGCLYSDPTFPASAGSLYRTPQQPPPGAMPPSLAAWARISQQEVRGCHSPVTFPTDGTPSVAVQGALGDSWLVSALNILITVPETLKKVLVSDRHRDKGIYTLKLYKEGSWRYLHVDDRLPCSPPHALHFCSTRDPNQLWAPLIEKAFAKIHGCYENLGRGSIEQGLRCLTGAPLLRTSLEGQLPSFPSVEHGGTASVTVEDETAERRRQELWSKMKRWQDRGCAMGCCRSVEYDRIRLRQKKSTLRTGSSTGGSSDDSGGGVSSYDRQHGGGLVAGRGYGIQQLCELSAPATPTHDAVNFMMVEVNSPWDIGEWKGDWSSASGLWKRYPSIDTDLRGGEEGGLGGVAEATNGRDAEEAPRSSRFWMAFEDFVSEFSQVLTCVSFSAGQTSRGLFRKSYRGKWLPGDPLTGSGGGCTSPSFLQNPFYPVTIQRNSTTFTVRLSVRDRAWQVDPSMGGPAIGYYILRLTGSKPRLTKLHPRKFIARSEAFLTGEQSAGEHILDSGRYAIVPITVKPLHLAEVFILELAADNTVEWEQDGDRVPDLDQPLRLSDDEGDAIVIKGAAAGSDRLPAGSGEATLEQEVIEVEDVDGPPENKVADAVHKQIADLSSIVAELTKGLQTSLVGVHGQPSLGRGGEETFPSSRHVELPGGASLSSTEAVAGLVAGGDAPPSARN